MSRVKTYCRAYRLAELRGFAGWAAGCAPESAALPDDTVVYLWDDLTVVADPVTPDSALLRAGAEPDAAWERFCCEVLEFEPSEGR